MSTSQGLQEGAKVESKADDPESKHHQPARNLLPDSDTMSISAKPVRIAFCITDLDPGGAERALVQLVTRLDRTTWEPYVFCLSKRGRLADELDRSGVPTVCLGARGIRRAPIVFRLSKLLKHLQPQVLQTYLYHANIAGRFAGHWAGIKHIVSGIRVAEKRSKLRLRIDRYSDRYVERHVCVSRAVAQFSQSVGRLPTDKIVVIHNGVDAERYANAEPADLTQFQIAPGGQTVLFVGRLDLQKSPFVLLKAVQGILQAHSDVHLLFVGDGPQRAKLEDWVHARGLGTNIHFAGWRDDVASIMRACQCLALPSSWEGMPNVVLEAMAAGLPVVATDVEGTSEVIKNHLTGLLVPPDSPRELASMLTLVLTDIARAQSLGAAAQVLVMEDFTWEQAVARYDRLYRGLLQI
jgi:glycosyltransferase involved in cell wall biosynthesis